MMESLSGYALAGFVGTNLLLGIGLAMDAFSVSIANGLQDPRMRRTRSALIAGTFAAFQFVMPLAGWMCVRFVARQLGAFQKAIPWISFFLLAVIGIRMIWSGIRKKEVEGNLGLSVPSLILQGIATSIDALSAGFAIASYRAPAALASAGIIAAVTFVICLAGVRIGRAVGMRFAHGATILGGVILFLIGLRILIFS